LRCDTALRRLLQLDVMPSSDATGDWLRRMGQGDGLEGMHRANRAVFQRILSRDARSSFTLDIDATQIVAEKRSAKWTYNSEKGYMPMVGHLPELGLVVAHEFREGNVAPQTGNLEFLQACDAAMPKGKNTRRLRTWGTMSRLRPEIWGAWPLTSCSRINSKNPWTLPTGR
jgi:hypothetical protein